MNFSLFLLALYLLWDNFLISEMTSIHVNNTTKKMPCQPQSVHSLGMLGAENATLPQLRDFWLQTRYKWDTRFLGGDFTQRRLMSTFRDNSRWWWNSHSSVGEDSSHLGCFALSTGQFTCIFRANSPRWRHYVPPKRPSPFTSRQGVIFINTCVRTSCLTD